MKSDALSPADATFVADAVAFLENPTLLLKMTNAVGRPIDAMQKKLPAPAQKYVQRAVERSLQMALKSAISTIKKKSPSSDELTAPGSHSKSIGRQHTAVATASGIIGGFFGLAAMPIELPLSTTVMLRGIARVAEEWGMNLASAETQMECLYVFTLGSQNEADDQMDSAYLSSRLVFDRLVREAARFLVQHSAQQVLSAVESKSAPVLLGFLARIASRFEIGVSQKLLATAIPIVGAIGGGAINAAFSDYFARAAHFHFGMRYLENKYGLEAVRQRYLEVSQAL